MKPGKYKADALERLTVAALIFVAAFSSVSCNSLRVHVSNTLPPSFTFNASRFAECCTNFQVFEVLEEGSEGSETPLWKIVAVGRAVERSEANSLVIHYGKVSDRFKQEIPTTGEPPPLVEGKHYMAAAGGAGYVPWARVRFVLAYNQAVALPAQPGDNP